MSTAEINASGNRLTYNEIHGLVGIYTKANPNVNLIGAGGLAGSGAGPVPKAVELRINTIETAVENLKADFKDVPKNTGKGEKGERGEKGEPGESIAGRDGLPGPMGPKGPRGDVEQLRDIKDVDISGGLEVGHVLVWTGSKWKARSLKELMSEMSM